jgi:hypothetical protein
MHLSSLDEQLAEILRPLVQMKAILRVSAYVNTLPLGFHYVLAHETTSPPSDECVGLAEWNHVDRSDLEKYLDGVFIFYGPKNQADQFRSLIEVPGYFNSVPVTRFRQRAAFVRRSPLGESLVDAVNGKLSANFFDEVSARGATLALYTDISEQARKLIETTTQKNLLASPVRFVEPMRLSRSEKDLALFIYGAPCIAYMARESDTFISMEVDESKIQAAPQYETHVIWHVPENHGDVNERIHDCMLDYHKCLFGAADSAADSEFTAMSLASSEVLAARHPSFQAEIFADPKTFKMCLKNHHSEPASSGHPNSRAA